jgi:hypothetical protein
MSVIDKLSGQSYGGVCGSSIKTCRANQVFTNWGDAYNGKINGDIVPFFEDFDDVFCVPDSIFFTEEEVIVGGAELFQQRVVALISKDEADRLQAIRRLVLYPQVVKFTDNNGNTKIIGEPALGCTCKFSRNQKGKIEDRNEMQIEFLFTSNMPALQLA